MSIKDTVDNLGGVDAVNAIDQLAGVLDPSAGTPANASQLEAGLAKSDVTLDQQINDLSTQIAAEGKQVDGNEQAIGTASTAATGIDLDIARLEGIETQIETEAADLNDPKETNI